MGDNERYNLGEILIAFSDAMDLASPFLAMHQQRTAYITWQISTAAGLKTELKERIFKAAILHDIGAITAEEKLSIYQCKSTHTSNHCILGEKLFNKVPWLASSSKIVRNHHKEWNNYDESVIDEDDLGAQILMLADTLDRTIHKDAYILHQSEKLKEHIKELSGSDLNPRIVEYFLMASDSDAFWLDLTSPKLYSILLQKFAYKNIEVDSDGMIYLSTLFKNLIDFRSHFTATHSTGVAACASMLCKSFGFSETEQIHMVVAGHLHDIGKLAVSNLILEKKGSLTTEEFAVMKQHTYHTFNILSKINGFKEIAEWAAFHHEKLDGSGYPFGLGETQINLGSRILAVSDIFTALSEDRPYRKGMEKEKMLKIIANMSEKDQLDEKVVEILVHNYDSILHHVKEEQNKAIINYEENYKQYLG